MPSAPQFATRPTHLMTNKHNQETPSPEYFKELLTVEEAAERLKLAPKTVRKLCRLRGLTAVNIQRRWRIPVTAIEEFLRDRISVRV